MKTNTVLEKKLEEIESLLQGGFDGDDLDAYREIEHRFIFTKTLLTAEISSVKDDVDDEEVEEEKLKLACMAKKLTGLEEVFVNQMTKPGMETGSVCSLVESLPEGFQEDKVVEEEEAVAGGETDEIKKNRFSGLVSFGIVGFITGMVSYFGYQMNSEDTTYFLTPT